MKKIISSAVAVVIFVFAPFIVFARDEATAPAYQNGDFWHFKATERDEVAWSSDSLRGDYEVSYLDSKLNVFQFEGNQKVQARSCCTAELKRMVGVDQDDRKYLQFPLFVGQQWKVRYRTTLRGAGPQQYFRDAETRVTGVEEVITSAGTFRALKLEREAWAGTARRSLTYYYSPLTRSIVKWSYYEENHGATCCKREIELINFGSAR